MVFPVAPVTDKAGTFVTWEGRPRAFEAVFTNPNALPDARILAGIAEELGRPLGFRSTRPTPAPGWSRWARGTASARPLPEAAAATGKGLRKNEPRPGHLEAHARQRLDAGRREDTSAPPRARRSAGSAGGRRGAGPAVTSPVTAARSRCRSRWPTTWPTTSVWVPANSTGNGVLADLASPGTGVRVKGADAVSAAVVRDLTERRCAGLDAFGQDPWWLILLKAVLIFVILVVLTLFNIWFERRVVARMQHRIGPNVNGPFGLLQSLADGVKLALKEDIIPKAADKVVFLAGPGDRDDPGVRRPSR